MLPPAEAIEDLACKESAGGGGLNKVLRLICLQSLVSSGLKAGLAVENPPKKTHPKKPTQKNPPKKTHLKKTTKNVFFGF
jgi:hypothetical protein